MSDPDLCVGPCTRRQGGEIVAAGKTQAEGRGPGIWRCPKSWGYPKSWMAEVHLLEIHENSLDDLKGLRHIFEETTILVYPRNEDLPSPEKAGILDILFAYVYSPSLLGR